MKRRFKSCRASVIQLQAMLDKIPTKVDVQCVLATVESGAAVEAFPTHDTRTKSACFKAFALKKWPKGRLDAVRVSTKSERLPLFGMVRAMAGIGSVIREQRPARATTRISRSATIPNGWSSSPRPVNRLQATGEPKYCESRRRVMRGGSKAKAWLQRTEQTRTCSKSQGKLSLSPKNSGSEYRVKAVVQAFLPFLASFSSPAHLQSLFSAELFLNNQQPNSMKIKIKPLWMVRYDADEPEFLSANPSGAIRKRKATPREERLLAMADMLDRSAENCNAHEFAGVHRKLAVLLRQEGGNELATRVMRRLVNYTGLYGLEGVCGQGDEELVAKELKADMAKD